MCRANTLLTLLQGCNSMQRLRKIHAQVLINGYQQHPSISTKLLSFCAVSTAGDLSYAHLLFSLLQDPHPQDWNSIIRGSSRGPSPLCSLSLYNAMRRSPHSPRPDPITFSFLLKACERARAEPKCREVHGSLIRFGFDSHAIVSTNLIRCYAENGSVEDARKVFAETPEKDLVSWNSMISCYHKVGLHEEALRVYEEMRVLNVGLDEFTVVGLLSSCAHVGALGFGQWVHSFSEENGFLERNVFVGNALIEMYAKCGSLEGARRVFNRMWKRDTFTWNSMIIGLGIHGHGEEASVFFQRMLVAGVRPNSITFLGLLMGCTHQGLVYDGLRYFQMMSSDFALKPDCKHYGCMVDLFGRANKINEALDIIRNSNCGNDPVLWRTLLNACRIYKNVKMGEVAMRNLVQLSAHNAGDCALLAEIYAYKGDNKGFARMRKMVKKQGIKTRPGWSWIEVMGNINKFVVGDISHPETKEIHKKLKEIIDQAVLTGYAHQKFKFLDREEFTGERSGEWMEKRLGYHSEMLAIVYGILRSPEGMALRIVKNLRVCEDCHSLTKFVSRAFGREIVVRDRVRFHHFKDGSCSCNDYW